MTKRDVASTAAKGRALTAKQEMFCIEYIKHGNASEAYRSVYNAGQMKPETINRAAKALLDNYKIATRVEELREPIIADARITLAAHIERLQHLSQRAEKDANWAGAIKAEELCGKVSGLYVEKVDLSGQVLIETKDIGDIFE